MFFTRQKFSDLNFFSSFVSSKLFLSLATALLAWQTFLILGVDLKTSKPLLTFIFFATLFAYNISRLIINPSKTESHSNWNLHIEKTETLKIFCAVAGFLFSCIFFFHLKGMIQSLIVVLAASTLAYIMPVSYNNKKIKGIRNIFILKNIWLALVWACVTVALPVLNSGYHFFSIGNLLLFVSRVLFIYSITLVFDIRDLKKDMGNNLKTLPAASGVAFTKGIAMLSLFAFCVLIYYRVQLQSHLSHIAPAFYISAMLVAVLILLAQPKNKLFFYEVMMDGMLVIQAVLVFLFYYFFK